MGENRGQTIFLSIIGIATLLVAIIGATFAYFTIGNATGTAGNVSAKTAKIGPVSFTADGVSEANAILPGWTSGAKNVKVTYGASDVSVGYTCTLNVTANSITDLNLAVAGTNSVSAANGLVKSGSTVIAKGTIPKSSKSQTVSMTYTLSFLETGADQNTQQGKNVAATVSCALNPTTIYYNNANPGGTGTAPVKK